jgi:hypothetical protein
MAGREISIPHLIYHDNQKRSTKKEKCVGQQIVLKPIDKQVSIPIVGADRREIEIKM